MNRTIGNKSKNKDSFLCHFSLQSRNTVRLQSSFLLFSFPLLVEHYYTTNIQKNQLVQNDIRVAKQLQDEEEERLAQQSAIIRQTSRQL